jgi:hypothetical protein
LKFARWVFFIAALYGIVVTLPFFFIEERLNLEYPPPINHPEYFYSFAGIVIVFQLLFLAIAWSPARYRPVMLFCVLEKLSLVPAFAILFPQGRFPMNWIAPLTIDIILGVLFAVAYVKSKPEPPPAMVSRS